MFRTWAERDYLTSYESMAVGEVGAAIVAVQGSPVRVDDIVLMPRPVLTS